MATRSKTVSAAPDQVIFSAFSAVLDEVDRTFSIGSIGKWLVMSRAKRHGPRETVAFMERVAGHGFNAVIAPEERDLLHKVFDKMEANGSDKETWGRLHAKLRRMRMTR